MYVVMNRVKVKNEWADEFENRFRKRAGQIDKEPGFVNMQILKPEAKETPYIVLTTWSNKADFENWITSDDFKMAHQNPMPKDAFDSGGGLEAFEVIITT